MSILLWIIFGALAGWITSVVMRTNTQQGVATDVVIGIVGALLGGWAMSFFGQTGVTGFNLYSFIVAILGAILLTAIVKAIRGGGQTSST